MKRVDLLGGDHRFEQPVRLLGARLRRHQSKSLAHAVHVRVHRKGWLVASEEQDTRRGLRTDATQGAKKCAPLFEREIAEKCQVEPSGARHDLVENRLDAYRLYLLEHAEPYGVRDTSSSCLSTTLPLA